MIVPSSNTVLEPVTAKMAAPLDGRVSCHFARIKVTEISLSGGAKAQFAREPVVAAARQLAEAQCDVIAWNGTSASFLGLDKDEALVEAIEGATGIAATTTSLCFREAYRRLSVKRLGLVTPYLSEIQERDIANYRAEGIEVVADRRLEDKGNFTFALYSADFVAGLIREAAEARPDAIAIVCTNFRGADQVARLEAELGLPVITELRA